VRLRVRSNSAHCRLRLCRQEESVTRFVNAQVPHRCLLLRSARGLAARANENTNGLLRQYVPKGFDFSTVTEAELDAVADELNERPRFEFATDRAALRAAVAMTARIRRSPPGRPRHRRCVSSVGGAPARSDLQP
jgi:hypothetical protein